MPFECFLKPFNIAEGEEFLPRTRIVYRIVLKSVRLTSLKLLGIKIMVSANVRPRPCSKFLNSFFRYHIHRTCAFPDKLLEVLSATLSQNWNSAIKGFCLCPTVLHAFTGKLCMKFWRKLNCHSQLSPQILKCSFFLFKVLALSK